MRGDFSGLIAEARATEGKGATVLLVDSGVDTRHPGLAERSVEAYPLTLGDGALALPGDRDPAGHGTACADLLTRVAPRARVVSCRVLGASLRTTSRALVEALASVRGDGGIDAINLSLGTFNPEVYHLLGRQVDRLYGLGIPVVASAGGDAGTPDYPAGFAAAISVAAAHRPTAEEDSLLFREGVIEFAARGDHEDVAWARGGWRRVSGSSFAAPVVSGWIALLKAARRDLAVFEIKSVLKAVAEPEN